MQARHRVNWILVGVADALSGSAQEAEIPGIEPQA